MAIPFENETFGPIGPHPRRIASKHWNSSGPSIGKESRLRELSYAHQTTIEAPPDAVFRFCSDLRNELLWNPAAKYVVKMTDGPVGVGTRFAARWDPLGTVTVEVVEYDPPRSWATYSCAVGLDVTFRGFVGAHGSRTVYTARVEVHPVGMARLYAPMAVLAMHHQEIRNMRLIRQVLEAAAHLVPA